MAAAARDMDTALALDEQVATALWGASARDVVADAARSTLMGGLIEQAAGLAEQAARSGRADGRPGYGEWTVVAVTAAAAATLATVPLAPAPGTGAPRATVARGHS